MKLTIARTVLSDCWRMHKLMDLDPDPENFRPIWVGALALLRTAADVIRREPGLNDVQKKFLHEDYKVIQFEKRWAFIKDSRDRAIHEYELDVDISESVSCLIMPIDDENAQAIFRIDGNLFRPINENPFTFEIGTEDARDVYAAALVWFETEIARLEKLIS